jgi:hypothetical protein
VGDGEVAPGVAVIPGGLDGIIANLKKRAGEASCYASGLAEITAAIVQMAPTSNPR